MALSPCSPPGSCPAPAFSRAPSPAPPACRRERSRRHAGGAGEGAREKAGAGHEPGGEHGESAMARHEVGNLPEALGRDEDPATVDLDRLPSVAPPQPVADVVAHDATD